ncbi:DUF721 domain-containing protein [Chthonobacter rhizosphaerae]|uniref:DUF721 domain-containing protein n=1 Tax=Chthonobacter rhizosphaerae TaxID=2735553 RepID=UPI0015EF60AF|nr:DciA family protein [Chthonobacter rhizosphaerae]
MTKRQDGPTVAADPAPKYAFKGARPLADIVGGALTVACRRRGFATVDIVAHWPDIVGPAYAQCTSPDRLSWAKRPKGLITEDEHEPAVLTVRCSGAAALRFTHELPQVVERINMFFGYRCVGRIKILQLPVARVEKPRRPTLGPISREAEASVRAAAEGFEDEALRAAIERLGLAVAGRAARPVKAR